MRVHSMGWGTGTRFHKGYIEDTILGYRHKVDPRMHAVCRTLNKQASVPLIQIRGLASTSALSITELDETLRGLARRGLLVCHVQRLTLRQSVYYVWTRLLTLSAADREAVVSQTLLVRSSTVRYDISKLGTLAAWCILLAGVAVRQGPLHFIYGMLIAVLAMVYAHASMWIAMPAGLLIAPFITVCHEWAHVAMVRIYALPGVLAVAPHRLSVVYRQASAKQQFIISSAGPVMPFLLWVPLGLLALLAGGATAEAVSNVWLLACFVQAISILPFMKDGRALLGAVKTVMKRGAYARPAVIQK